MNPSAPPTVPGPLPTRAQWWKHSIVTGILTHAVIACITAVGVPLVMGSNIWPIAAVFWMVLLLPLACGTGSLTGWLVKPLPKQARMTILIITGVILAVIAGLIMSQT